VLREYADRDLVLLLGPASEPARALSAGRPDVAEQLLAPWCELAGPRLRLESVYLGREGTGPGSLRLAARTVGLADQLGVPVVLTNTVRYADPAQHRLADVLDAARLGPSAAGTARHRGPASGQEHLRWSWRCPGD
jgi:error-prone DNA polymerase